jgi:orotate phosphoribosyltransferase
VAQPTTPQHRELFAILKQRSFKRGDFVLASGARSSWYLDCRVTALSGRASYLIGQLFWERLQGLNIDAVGGMALGAAPLVTAVTCRSAEVGNPVDGFLVRKEAKGHGTAKQIEGNLAPWMRIALLEDVITTGGSTLKAIEAIRAAHPNVQIVKVLALVDREAGGAEHFTRQGIPFESLYSVREFLAE